MTLEEGDKSSSSIRKVALVRTKGEALICKGNSENIFLPTQGKILLFEKTLILRSNVIFCKQEVLF